MEEYLLNYQFSIIGKFDKLYNNIFSFSSDWTNFKKEAMNDYSPSGNGLNCYILSNEEVRIVIRIDRIDFMFPKLSDDDCDSFLKYFAIFKNGIDSIFRIAINYQLFYEDTDSVLENKMSELINIFKSFGNSKEFNLSINIPFSKNQMDYNDITLIQNGDVQKKDSFQSLKALLASFDINSAYNPLESKLIEHDKLALYFKVMFDRLNEKREFLKKYLG